MKNVIMAALLLVGTFGFSQGHKEHDRKREPKVQLTAEQRNDLRLKEMTLKLDLTASQQKEMKKIIADQEKSRSEAIAKMKENREKKTKPTADEIYAMQSKKLDAQIENRAKMKKLLNDEQFAKWEKLKERHKQHFGHKRQKGDRDDNNARKKVPDTQE